MGDDTEQDTKAEKAWKGKIAVESDGNYLGETFLEVGPLYAQQDQLQCLPVPSLSETIQTFLPSALPLAESEEEVSTLQVACDRFEEQASILQERLKARAQDCHSRKTSWLQEFWQRDMYLRRRSTLLFNTSYYFLVNDPDPFPSQKNHPALPAIKAAALCKAAFEYAETVTSGTKPPDLLGKKKELLCSVGYKYLFHACRIPQPGMDRFKIYNPFLHKHVIVACRGYFYELPLTKDGHPLQRRELEHRIARIQKRAETSQAPVLELGWLTTWDREPWAETRNLLVERGGEEMIGALERIESALLVINLDIGTITNSLQEQVYNFWTGGLCQGMNRWWDKAAQLAVTENGKWSYLGEHSMMDGLNPANFCDYLMKNAKSDATEETSPDSFAAFEPVDVFHNAIRGLSDENLADFEERIQAAKSDFVKLNSEVTMKVLLWDFYGSTFIKQAGVSPDAYVQLAFQLAIYRCFGKLVATYESAQVRRCLHGRTETSRAVSPAVLKFCQAIKDQKNNGVVFDKEGAIKLLKEAALAHVNYCRKASAGMGCDRHFYGLTKMISDGEKTPDLFRHPLFERSRYFRLSTSTLPTCPGFGMVVDDGIGVGYGIYEHHMIFNICAKSETGVADSFPLAVTKALHDMKTLVT